MAIILKGSILNAFQLIGAIAAQKKLADKYQSVTYLDLTYSRYWPENNIADELLQMINTPKSDDRRTTTKTFLLAINSPRPLKFNQLIIDDGIGAFRKDPLALLNIINTERLRNGGQKIRPYRAVVWLVAIAARMLFSSLHRRHISIFKKSFRAYYQIDEENKKYFIDAIKEITSALPPALLSAPPDPQIIFLSQPYDLIGFSHSQDYSEFVDRLAKVCIKENPGCSFFVKKHPLDKFDYEKIGIGVVGHEKIPAELYFYQNQNNIKQIIGFTSTSLFTGKILFNIPAYYIVRKLGLSISGDFWIDKGFRKHLTPLQLFEHG